MMIVVAGGLDVVASYQLHPCGGQPSSDGILQCQGSFSL